MIKNNLPAIHPIHFLNEALNELSFKQKKLIDNKLIKTIEKNGINKEISEHLGRVFNTSSKYWLNLQADYDLKLKQ